MKLPELYFNRILLATLLRSDISGLKTEAAGLKKLSKSSQYGLLDNGVVDHSRGREQLILDKP